MNIPPAINFIFPLFKFIRRDKVYQKVDAVGANHADRNGGHKSEGVSCVFECVWHRQNSTAHASLDQMQKRFQVAANAIFMYDFLFLIRFKTHVVGRVSTLCAYGSYSLVLTELLSL